MLYKTIIIVLFFSSAIHISFTQDLNKFTFRSDNEKSAYKISKVKYDYKQIAIQRDSLHMEPKFVGSKKSPGLAMILSLLVPGTGQLYSHRFDAGKYFMISEASLWLGFASFTIYGNWLLTDAHKYAQLHAGIDPNGKDDNFFINISNYDNVDEYNDEQLRFGNYDKLYDPLNGYYFYWDNVPDRQKYRVDQLAGDRVITDRLFIVGAIIVNHIISAISAIILTNSYNDQLRGSKGGFSVSADVMRNGPRVDGLQLKFMKWF